jgi:hypothetical protein
MYSKHVHYPYISHMIPVIKIMTGSASTVPQHIPLDRSISEPKCYSLSFVLFRSETFHGVGASKATLAQAAEQVPNALLQATIVAGAVAPTVAPHVYPAAP